MDKKEEINETWINLGEKTEENDISEVNSIETKQGNKRMKVRWSKEIQNQRKNGWNRR